jgi:bifunctional ADP-heptose synthase (sugar kinase/adenylyltransferase)
MSDAHHISAARAPGCSARVTTTAMQPRNRVAISGVGSRSCRYRRYELTDIVAGARALHAAGVRRILISRSPHPAILVDDGENPTLLELSTPVFEELDHRGDGDSMVAATGVGLARGMTLRRSVRLGMAAGALSVTRRGLGTGTRDEIERLATHVTIRPSSVPARACTEDRGGTARGAQRSGCP